MTGNRQRRDQYGKTYCTRVRALKSSNNGQVKSKFSRFQINVALAAWQCSWFSHSSLFSSLQVRIQHVCKSTSQQVYWSFRFASSTLTSLQASRYTGLQVCIQHTHKSASQQVYWSSDLHPAHSQVYKPAGLLVSRFASSTLTSLQVSRSTGLQVCIQHTHKSASQQAYLGSRHGTVVRVLTPPPPPPPANVSWVRFRPGPICGFSLLLFLALPLGFLPLVPPPPLKPTSPN